MRKARVTHPLAVLFGAGLWLSAAVADDVNVAGTWTGTVTVRQRNTTSQDEFTLVLTQNGQTLTGTWSHKQGGAGRRGGRTTEDIPAKGTLAGDKVSLKIGQRRWLEATVSGDSMNGTAGVENGSPGDLAGTRSK